MVAPCPRPTVKRAGSSPLGSIVLSSLLALASAWPGAARASGEPPPPVPAPLGERPSLKEPLDADPGLRKGAQSSMFGRYLSDAYKQNFIRELARKNALYPNQSPGATPPPGMPVWSSMGPTTDKYLYNGVTIDAVDSGRIRTILPDPGNPQKVYVLTGGGLWKSTDFQSRRPHWSVLTDALVSTSGGAAALGRTSDVVYLGIGDPWDVLSTVAGVFVKSTDGGQTWSPFVKLTNATTVRDVKIDTSGPTDIVLVATDVGLFRSTDGGTTFALTSAGQAQGLISAWSLARTSAGWLVQMVDPAFDTGPSGLGAIYVSSDHGATWSPIPNAGGAFGNVGRATLGVAVPGESTVFAIGSDPSGVKQSDLYRSTDGGLNWTALGITGKKPANPNCFQPDMNILGDQAYYNQMIAVSPGDAARNTVYIGGNLSTAKTTDGGATWRLTSSWLPKDCNGITPILPYVHADNHASAIQQVGTHEQVIFGTDGGIFITEDGGLHFDSSKNTGIVSLLSQTIISTPTRNDSAMTGMQDTGTRARLRGSTTWNQVMGGDGEGVGWSQANNAVSIATAEFFFIVTQPGLPPSTGNPADWQDGTAGIDFTDPDCFPFYTPIATPTATADPTGLVFYTATGSRLYRTTDGAHTWSQVVQFGTVASPQCIIRQHYHPIGLHPSDPQRIALAGASGRAIVSTDGGASWTVTVLTGVVPGWAGFNSSAAWSSNGILYLASESPNPGDTRFARSTDNGLTWQRADFGLPDVAVADIVADPRDPTGRTVYAATWIGVYVTRNGGLSWTLYGAGLPNVYVAGLYLSPTENFLRVATYGRGVWEIDIPRGR